MLISSLKIDGRNVVRLSIDGRKVKLGSSEEPGYLCFTSESGQSVIQLVKVGSPAEVLIETSTDGRNWRHYEVGDTTTSETIGLIQGEKVYFKAMGVNDTFSTGASNYYQFVMQGMIAASGNVNSLLNENFEDVDTLPNYCFYSLFLGCSALTAAPELPATAIGDYCYRFMFRNCTALTTAPELPATAIGDYCYNNMFIGCTSLTQAPNILPAVVLKANCYSFMFSGCTALTTAPEIKATTLADYCCQAMFQGCEALTTAPYLPATELALGCYA